METNSDKIRNSVRENYSRVAGSDPKGFGCCSPENAKSPDEISSVLGYSSDELSNLPVGANLGLGCGNPQAIANLKEGEVVVDLGSGAGIDVFLAAKQVGNSGKVIGIDMTPKMISKARENAAVGNYKNVDFRLGEIERIPVADNSVDVIISNCVINLSPEKTDVFNESFRILKKGGRLAVSDIVATKALSGKIRNDMALYSACASGASTIQDIEKMLKTAGFEDIRIVPKKESREIISEWISDKEVADSIVSATIEAVKP